MRKLYLLLIILICVSIILFVATFFYMDTHRHTVLYYNIYQDRNLVSTVQLDKYNTEDRIVYKSIATTPFHSVSNERKRNLTIDKKGIQVYSYNKKNLSEGVNMDIDIRVVDSSINFLALGHSNFAYANRLPIDKDSVIFEIDAIISYFNLMDKYDFKKSGVQTFPILTHTYTFLPPYKSMIEAKFIDEEIIKIDGKKIKALRFKVRLPDKKEVLLWSNRWAHTPLRIKIPKTGFEAVLSETLQDISAKTYRIENDLYEDKEVSFNNKDITLSGTLSMPKDEGPFPAIILICGPGPQDRNGLGMFVDLADGLAQKGIAVLRFDKRGVGKSEGSFSRFTDEDLISDVSSAVDFLAKREDIDRDRIAVLGHSQGGYYAVSVAASHPQVSACIIMAGIEAMNLPDTDLEMMWSFDKSALDWGQEYLKDIAECTKDTSEILKTGNDWAILLHKRVFLKKRRLDIEKKPLELIRKVKTPVLILRGKRDAVIPVEHIKLLEETLKEGANKDYEIVYFNRLNHFFGKKIEDGIYRTHLSIDKEVAPAVIDWLNKKMISLPEPEPDGETESQKEVLLLSTENNEDKLKEGED